MKKIIKQYEEEFKSLLKNKLYICSIIIVAILSYGYFVTHCTIGMDDTCLDRYYGDFFSNNIISITGRWGSYFLYKILDITQFTPFWLEILCVLILSITAMIISCFIRKNIIPRDNIVSIIFSCIYISYSLINEPLIFQSSNFALLIGNLLAIVAVILIYEMFNEKYDTKNYIKIILVLTIAVSMYESCCQTFLVGLLFCIIYNLFKDKENDKELLKHFFIGIVILVISIILYYVILYTFYFIGVPTSEVVAEKQINWFEYGLFEGMRIVVNTIYHYTIGNAIYFPVLEFSIASIIGVVLSIYYSVKTNKINIFNIYVFIILSNFALSILQCGPVLYRTCTSWSLFVAGIFTITYVIMSKNKYFKKIAIILITLIILWQTKDLNQWFYSEYMKYQKDLNNAYQIAEDIKREANDINKPIVFVGIPEKAFYLEGQRGAQFNGLYVIWWGQKAFDDNSYELIKFINSLGYDFNKPTDEQYKRGKELAEDMSNYHKDGYIKEFEDIIVIKFN